MISGTLLCPLLCPHNPGQPGSAHSSSLDRQRQVPQGSKAPSRPRLTLGHAITGQGCQAPWELPSTANPLPAQPPHLTFGCWLVEPGFGYISCPALRSPNLRKVINPCFAAPNTRPPSPSCSGQRNLVTTHNSKNLTAFHGSPMLQGQVHTLPPAWHAGAHLHPPASPPAAP